MNENQYQVQQDGKIVQIVSIETVQAQLAATQDFLSSAQAGKIAADDEWDAKILDLQAQVNSLQAVIAQAQNTP